MNKSGFTLIELLVVIAIIGLLSSVVLASLNSARGKARFSQALATMNSIEKAAILDFDDFNFWAPDVGSGPTRFVPKYLPKWPTPPCSGWNYDWENWATSIRVTLRRVGDNASIYYYCIDNLNGAGNCATGGGSDIKTASSKTLTCNE